ncbi:MAG: hypothetical protein JWM68_4277 [Verrucomicrobiales bacterium]|nr:hypothetical protein [Verrucomicrobiales bacterium]
MVQSRWTNQWLVCNVYAVSSPSQIAVIVPCHNEATTIAALVGEIKKHLPHVIVIDDGSTDETSRLARSGGAEIIRNDAAQGKGAALRAGWKRAMELGFQWALTMDGDGQHSPGDIPKFLNALERAPLVIGNRMFEQDKIPRLRRMVNRWMSKRLSTVAGRELPDTQCGFRLINLKAWSGLNLQTTHFEIESELLLAFIAAGYHVEFIPIEVIYKNERSKIRPWQDTIRWFRWFRNLRTLNARFSPCPHCAEKPTVSANPVSVKHV